MAAAEAEEVSGCAAEVLSALEAPAAAVFTPALEWLRHGATSRFSHAVDAAEGEGCGCGCSGVCGCAAGCWPAHRMAVKCDWPGLRSRVCHDCRGAPTWSRDEGCGGEVAPPATPAAVISAEVAPSPLKGGDGEGTKSSRDSASVLEAAPPPALNCDMRCDREGCPPPPTMASPTSRLLLLLLMFVGLLPGEEWGVKDDAGCSRVPPPTASASTAPAGRGRVVPPLLWLPPSTPAAASCTTDTPSPAVTSLTGSGDGSSGGGGGSCLGWGAPSASSSSPSSSSQLESWRSSAWGER